MDDGIIEALKNHGYDISLLDAAACVERTINTRQEETRHG